MFLFFFFQLHLFQVLIITISWCNYLFSSINYFFFQILITSFSAFNYFSTCGYFYFEIFDISYNIRTFRHWFICFIFRLFMSMGYSFYLVDFLSRYTFFSGFYSENINGYCRLKFALNSVLQLADCKMKREFQDKIYSFLLKISL